MKGFWIEDVAWPLIGEKIAAGWPVIIPIGARSKEHGHHLPMKTDYLLARAFGDGIAQHLPTLIAPVVDFGYYPAFLRYPGSQHLRAETFIAVMEDVIEGFIRQGAKSIAIVNTGVSTEGPVQIAVRNIFSRHALDVAVADIRSLGKNKSKILQQKLGGHGDEHETSLILAIEPQSVDMSKAQTDYGNMLTEPSTVFYQPTEFMNRPEKRHHYSATGVRGDPTLATAEKGRALLQEKIEELVAGLRALFPVVDTL